MNKTLKRAYSREEIEKAIFEMNPLGFPGLDGFPAVFYQDHWPMVGTDIVVAVMELLNSKQGFQAINHTYITLIPKKTFPTLVTDFRPICLYNVFYKIIAKVLANRLNIILHNLISNTQSAFVPGRMITDNIIMAYELMHSMQNKMRGEEERLYGPQT